MPLLINIPVNVLLCGFSFEPVFEERNRAMINTGITIIFGTLIVLAIIPHY